MRCDLHAHAPEMIGSVFLASGRRAAWVSCSASLVDSDVEVFLRRSTRSPAGSRGSYLDVASVTVKESMRRQGVLRRVLDELEGAPAGMWYDGVFFESVLPNGDGSPHFLEAYLERRGYLRQSGTWPVSMYKIL